MTGKIALVTGGTRGIGRAIALRLAEEGADVVINFFRNRKPAEETKAMIEALGRRCHIIKANVGDLEKHQVIFDEIQDVMGGLDILVSNAASGVQLPAMEVEEKHWDWTLNINAKALLFLAQKAVPMMEARGGGSIVAISSLGSRFALKNYTCVGTSKAALESLVRYLGVELAPKNIIVNGVSGAAVDTDALTHFPNREEMIQHAIDRTPAGRMITPEDLANSVLFLCSDQSRMIVGQTLVIDGGFSLIG
nr:enoyl-[acyl-carrier-protein] reductase FabL [Tumebacillus permanentifrigoris]